MTNDDHRYMQILELLPELIFVHRDGVIVYMNQAGLNMLGATKSEQIIGQSLWNLYPPERHGIVRARNQMMEQTGESAPLIEHTILRVDGTPLHVEAKARIIDYEGKRAFFVVMRDITERVKIRLLLELQYSVSKNFLESEHLVDASINVLKVICDKLKFISGNIWHFDKKAEVLRCIASWVKTTAIEHDSENLRETIKPQEGLVGQVFYTVDPVWQELEQDPYKLCIALPISSGREIIGVMELLSNKAMRKDPAIMQALSGVSDQIGSFIKRKAYEKELRYISKHDVLTGLSNRNLFEENLAYEINLAKNNDQRLALLNVDVNFFRSINGAMGHEAGDQLLKQMATRLIELGCSPEHMSRFGDDQFGLILRNVNSVNDVTDFIQRINAILNKPFNVNNSLINITVSIGVGFYPEDGEDLPTLMKSASTALSIAKETGKGNFQFSNFDITANAKKRISIENDLRQGLARNEFFLCYQPIVGTPDNVVKGFESLLRWRRNGVLVSPGDFIPIIENTHLIIPVGEWLIYQACKECKKWQDISKDPVFVSVNVSGIQFNNVDIPSILSKALSESGLDPKCLKVEITETTIMEDVQKNINVLRKIKDLGVSISIDDFGTGYSSLNYLRNLPVDYLKIDQSFVRDMLKNTNDAAIVKTIIELGNNLGYGIIAEGVETKEQLSFINHLGCYLIQGYYFSRPLEADEATDFLKQGKIIG